MRAYVACVVKNGESPPVPTDEEEAEFYEERGIACLSEEWQRWIAHIFFRCLKSAGGALELDVRLVQAYCDAEELEFLDIYEILSALLCEANKQSAAKAYG